MENIGQFLENNGKGAPNIGLTKGLALLYYWLQDETGRFEPLEYLKLGSNDWTFMFV